MRIPLVRVVSLMGLALLASLCVRWVWRDGAKHIDSPAVSVVGVAGDSGGEDADLAASAYQAVGASLAVVGRSGVEARMIAHAALDEGRQVALQGHDSEWRRFQRRKFTPVTEVVGGVEVGFDASHFFRNIFFNPADRYIPPEIRKELVNVLELVGEKSSELRVVRNRVTNREFEALIASGGAKRLQIPVKNGMVNMYAARKAGADMVSVRDGTVYGALRSEMEESSMIVDMERAMKLDIVAGIALWFRSVGALSASQHDRLVEAAADTIFL